jgi:hypothetical protein
LNQDAASEPTRPTLFLDLWANYAANADIFEHSRCQPEGPIIRHRACERFGHASFTPETMQRLTDWLKDRSGPDVDVFGLSLREVAERLKPQAPLPPDTILSLGKRQYRIGDFNACTVEQTSPIARAIALMTEHQRNSRKLLTVREILKAIPDATKSTLYRSPLFRAARKAIKQSLRAHIPKGYKSADGNMDAFSEDE